MSGFGNGPFEDNPFQDPSIEQATQNSASNVDIMEDYNPFGGESQNQRPTTVPTPSNDAVVRGAANPPPQAQSDGTFSPAVMSPTQEISSSSAMQSEQPPPQVSMADLHRRQEELLRKERELERREEELKNIPFNARKNNWPPLPTSCPIQPCFYQDINVDIPVEFQRIVRYLYYLWVLHAAVLMVNSVVFVLRVIFLHTSSDFGGFILSLFYIVIFAPTSYICWFRPAYKAFRTDSSFNFVVFFFIFFFQFILSILMSVYMAGSCGVWIGIATMRMGGVGNIIIGILITMVGAGFILLAVLDILMLLRIHKVYRSSGASLVKAQQEFTSGVFRNEHVQSAAANFASEVVRQTGDRTFNNQQQQQQQRY